MSQTTTPDIIKIVKESLLKQDNEPRTKNSFWATDSEKMAFDIYHAWIGTEPTNPMDAEKLMMFSSAKMIELAYVEILKDSLVPPDPVLGQHRIEIEREGVPITGYLDGLLKGVIIPLEVKTFYGDYQERELLAGKPKTSYLKQLGIYMDAKGADTGVLLYVNRGTGATYQFVLRKIRDRVYQMNDMIVDLNEVYKRWAKIYNENIVPRIEPIPDKKYKFPVHEVDWSKVPKAKIMAARNNHAVYGDWEVLYSPYKDLIVEREGTCLGYSLDELTFIKNATAGYSTK